MQQQELAMKQAEIQRKAQKDMADIELRKRQQEIEAGRIISQAEFQKQKLQSESELEAIRTAAEMRDGREKEIIRMGVDIAKQLSSQAHQKEIQQRQPQQPKANK